MVQRPAEGIFESFQEVARRHEDRTALIFLGERFPYKDLLDMVLRFSEALLRLGIQEGDRVLLYLYNMPQTIIAILALRRIGALAVPVAPVYGAHDLRYLASDSGAVAVLAMDSNYNYVNEVLPGSPLRRVIVTNLVDMVPRWKRWIARGFDRVPRGRRPSGEGISAFMDLLQEGRPSRLPPFRPPDPQDPALILYTGGTTGFPKGVPLPDGLFLHKAVEWRRASEAVTPLGEGVTALAAPLYHIIGEMDALAPLLVSGETVLVLPRVVLDALMDHIARYRATNMFAVPALYRMILDHDRVDFYDLSSLRYCGTGGDVLPVEVGRRWYQKFGIPLYQGYGTTEFCGAISLSYACDGPPPEGAAGKIVPGSRVKLVEPGTLTPVLPGEPGELLGTSDCPVRQYWNKPQETAQCFLEVEGDVWYRSQDIVRIDQDGWLYFLDRSADMIKHKGYRIAAAEIERVLQEHHAVTAACVVGVPDDKVGERIKAFVVLKPDIRGVSSYELTRWCRDRLAPYKVPHYIEFRDMLPKSKVGKMLRREMRAEEQRKRSA